MFESVVADCNKELNNELNETNQAIKDILLDKNNYANYERGLLTDEAAGAELQLSLQRFNLNSDLNSLKFLK